MHTPSLLSSVERLPSCKSIIDIPVVLVRFKYHRVALAADIEKAFLVVQIKEADRDVLRFLWIDDTDQQPENTSTESITIGDTVIKPLESVRNLGSWFDAHMRLNVHIGKICSGAFCGLYNISQIRKFLAVQ